MPLLDQRDASEPVRMSFRLGRGALRCPPSIANSDQPQNRLGLQIRAQIFELAYATADLDLRAIQHGNCGTVIADILKSPDSLDEPAREISSAKNT